MKRKFEKLWINQDQLIYISLSQRSLLNILLAVSISHAYFIVGLKLPVFSFILLLFVTLHQFIFLLLFHDESCPRDIFGLSENEYFTDHVKDQG